MRCELKHYAEGRLTKSLEPLIRGLCRSVVECAGAISSFRVEGNPITKIRPQRSPPHQCRLWVNRAKAVRVLRRRMSVAPRKRQSAAKIRPVVKGQEATYAPQQTAPLFDHFVGAQQERFRDCQPERFGGGQIDDEIELGRLIDRDIARLRPAQNFVSIVGGTLKLVREVWSIGHRRQACG